MIYRDLANCIEAIATFARSIFEMIIMKKKGLLLILGVFSLIFAFSFQAIPIQVSYILGNSQFTMFHGSTTIEDSSPVYHVADYNPSVGWLAQGFKINESCYLEELSLYITQAAINGDEIGNEVSVSIYNATSDEILGNRPDKIINTAWYLNNDTVAPNPDYWCDVNQTTYTGVSNVFSQLLLNSSQTYDGWFYVVLKGVFDPTCVQNSRIRWGYSLDEVNGDNGNGLISSSTTSWEKPSGLDLDFSLKVTLTELNNDPTPEPDPRPTHHFGWWWGFFYFLRWFFFGWWHH